MQEYIKSATIKKYLSDNQIKLSDRHICALACNSLLAWNDVRKLFLEVAERTLDTDLKNQIAELTAAVEAKINEFITNDGAYIYRLKVYSEEDSCYSEKGYYYSYDTAFDIAKAFNEKFKIKKLRTYKSREEAEGVLADEAVTGDEFCFNRDGQIKYQSIYTGIYDKREKWFEEEWYEFPHPFQKGDMVKRIGDSENGYADYVYVICDTEVSGICECYSDIGIWLTALDCKTGKI